MLQKINLHNEKIFDSNWNKGIILGNIIIFTSNYKQTTKKIKNMYKKDNESHILLVEYKNDPVLHTLYIR